MLTLLLFVCGFLTRVATAAQRNSEWRLDVLDGRGSHSDGAVGGADALQQPLGPVGGVAKPVPGGYQAWRPAWLALGFGGALVVVAMSPILVQRGIVPFVIVLIYLTSLTLVQILFKMALESGFRYPYTITSCHLVVTTVVATCMDPAFRLREAAATVPVSVANGLSVALNNTSLVYAGVGFVTMMSSCTPATTCAVELALRRREFSWGHLAAVLVVCIGGITCTTGEHAFSHVALMLTVAAAVLRSLRCVWQHDLLRKTGREDQEAAISPCRLVAWSSLLFLMPLVPFAVHCEGSAPWVQLPYASTRAQAGVVGSTLAAMVLNISQSVALQYVGPLMQHAVGNLQLVVVIFLASAWLQETVSLSQWGGTLMIVVGVMLVNGPAHLRALKSASSLSASV